MNDANPPTDGTGASPAPPIPPPRIPDHELIKPIGRGAYGEVWIARSVTGAFRAVKIVRRSSFDHDRPFEREFEGIQKFEPVSRTHDSQVDILHVGRGEDYFYYVMELADDQVTGGQINPDNYHPRTLKSDLLFHSRLSFEECVSIGLALTTALEHLHQSGLVHRDVKPSNIIFVNGVAKLADIGLVTGVDTTRSYVGTEGFAAPEGSGTAQGDLYSLGKVLYEMSTGKDRQEFPELPTNLRELPEREGLMELNAVIAQACRHDPRDRYTSAGAMRADLELLQSGKSLARLHRIENRLRVVSRLGLAGSVVAVLVAAAWLYQSFQTREARRLATHNQQLIADMTVLADEKAKGAEENRERLVRLNIADGLRAMDEEPPTALLWFAEALPLLTNRPNESAVHRLRLQQMLDTLAVPLHVLDYKDPVMAGAFSADGTLFVTATSGGELRICDAQNGAVRWTKQADFPVFQVRFTRNGQHLLLASSRPSTSAFFAEPDCGGAAILDWKSNENIFSQTFCEFQGQGLTNQMRAAFSSDDRWLAYASSNNVICVVDVPSGRTILELSGHSDQITTLSFSADGTLLASGGDDGEARLWRVPTGEPVGEPLRHSVRLSRVALSDAGGRLAVLSGRGTNWSAHFWETRTGTEVRSPFPLLVDGMCTLAFADSSGRRVLIGGNNDQKERRALFLDLETGEELLPSRSVTPRSWAFAPDGESVAIGTDGGSVSVLSTKTGELVFPLIRHGGWVESVAWSPDASCILATRDSATAVVSKLKRRSPPLEKRLDAPIPRWERPRFVGAVKVPQRRLVLPLEDGTLRVIDLERFEEVEKLKPTVTTNIPYFASSPDARHWAAREMMGASQWGPTNEFIPQAVDLWRKENGDPQHRLLTHPARVGMIRFDPTSAYLLTHCGDQRIRFWKTADGQVERSVPLPEGIKRNVMIFPDGKTLLLRHRSNLKYQLFDLVTERFTGQPLEDLDALVSIDFDLKSGRFATADNFKHSGRIWSARTGDPLTPLLRQSGRIESIVWSPDGHQVITAGLGTSQVWDSRTGEKALPSPGDNSPLVSTWSTDGRFIVVPSSKGARVFDAATSEAVGPLFSCEGYVRLATIVQNRLIILSDPNVLQAWTLEETQLPIDVLQDYARLLSGRRINSKGFTFSLKPHELVELHQSLKRRAPDLFTEQ